ncbi:MAG: 5'/3'-nucleotidase SurE [Pseudomonadota bacterium]
MRILISNDDGIDAPGLASLAEAMSEFGECFISAPDRERSGAGHSLTLHRPIRILPRGHRRFATDGTPTDSVSLGVLEILKDHPPDLVVSGINFGANIGDDVTYSGTLAAALEGAILGIPAIAFSLAASMTEEPNFAPAAYFARKLVRQVLVHALPRGAVLNVNVPNMEGDRIDDYQITRLGRRRYAGAIAEKIDPRGKKYYWIGAEELGFDDIPGSDSNAIRLGKVSITPIRLDITHEECIEELKKWSL